MIKSHGTAPRYGQEQRVQDQEKQLSDLQALITHKIPQVSRYGYFANCLL